MPSKRKRILLAIVIICVTIISGFSIFVVVEKEIWLKVNPTNLVNNTIDIYINDKNAFHQAIDNHTLERHPSTIGSSTKVTGIQIDVKVRLAPLNGSLEKTFNLMGGNYFSVSYSDNDLKIDQLRGWPSEE